jgi:hypothetical protein
VPDTTKQEPAQAAPVKRPKKDATYHVFQEVEAHWHKVTKTAITASSRKDAITKAIASLEDKTGRFWAVIEREFQPFSLKVETEVKHIFE